MNVAEESTVLSSWKDIARYLGKGVRTVQRWEQHLGLPVRRPVGASQKSAVLLHRGDLDAWLETRFAARTVAIDTTNPILDVSVSARAELRQSLQKAYELQKTQEKLTQEIAASIRLLSERCSLLSVESRGAPGRQIPYTGPGLVTKKSQSMAERTA